MAMYTFVPYQGGTWSQSYGHHLNWLIEMLQLRGSDGGKTREQMCTLPYFGGFYCFKKYSKMFKIQKICFWLGNMYIQLITLENNIKKLILSILFNILNISYHVLYCVLIMYFHSSGTWLKKWKCWIKWTIYFFTIFCNKLSCKHIFGSQKTFLQIYINFRDFLKQ